MAPTLLDIYPSVFWSVQNFFSNLLSNSFQNVWEHYSSDSSKPLPNLITRKRHGKTKRERVADWGRIKAEKRHIGIASCEMHGTFIWLNKPCDHQQWEQQCRPHALIIETHNATVNPLQAITSYDKLPRPNGCFYSTFAAFILLDKQEKARLKCKPVK